MFKLLVIVKTIDSPSIVTTEVICFDSRDAADKAATNINSNHFTTHYINVIRLY